MKMKNITVRDISYKVRTFEELSGGDWDRLTKNLERTAAYPSEFPALSRSFIAIVAPLAARDSKKWNEAELKFAAAQAMTSLAASLKEGADLMKRYREAAEAIVARLVGEEKP